MQFEDEAKARAESLRASGLEVAITQYEGGFALAISGPPNFMEAMWREIYEERRARAGRVLSGTVRGWKDTKGYGRITGDDGYIYFCHFSALLLDGYRTLREGSGLSSSLSKAYRLGAVKHSIIWACWHMLTTGELYRDRGDYFHRREPERQTRRLVAQLEALGHTVTLEKAA